MQTLGAELLSVGAGEVRVGFQRNDQLFQQHGFLHAGVCTSIVDTACGYAALTLAEEGRDVLTVEFKVNFLKPAAGDGFEAIGRVLRSGRLLSVCEGEVWQTLPERIQIAKMTATMITAEPATDRS